MDEHNIEHRTRKGCASTMSASRHGYWSKPACALRQRSRSSWSWWL